MRLAICDDERLLAESLAVAFAARGCEVVAAATTPAECLSAVARWRPDVCLLDLCLPGPENGLDTLRVIRAGRSRTRVLILSGTADPGLLARAIELGVDGVARKDQTVDAIAAAVWQVADGQPVFPAGLVHDVVRHLAQRPAVEEPWHRLTARELEVLHRIAAGESTKQMARSMRIGSATVRTHVQSVLVKLGVHSRLEASAIAAHVSLGRVPASTVHPHIP